MFIKEKESSNSFVKRVLLFDPITCHAVQVDTYETVTSCITETWKFERYVVAVADSEVGYGFVVHTTHSQDSRNTPGNSNLQLYRSF